MDIQMLTQNIVKNVIYYVKIVVVLILQIALNVFQVSFLMKTIIVKQIRH